MTSAGNSETSPSMGNELGGLNESKNPDISVISAPAVYPSNLSVASVNSSVDLLSILKWGDMEIGYSDPTSIAMKSKFAGKGEFVVYDAGYGTYDDYQKAGFDTGTSASRRSFVVRVYKPSSMAFIRLSSFLSTSRSCFSSSGIVVFS